LLQAACKYISTVIWVHLLEPQPTCLMDMHLHQVVGIETFQFGHPLPLLKLIISQWLGLRH
jgi:hypothetical protein